MYPQADLQQIYIFLPWSLALHAKDFPSLQTSSQASPPHILYKLSRATARCEHKEEMTELRCEREQEMIELDALEVTSKTFTDGAVRNKSPCTFHIFDCQHHRSQVLWFNKVHAASVSYTRLNLAEIAWDKHPPSSFKWLFFHQWHLKKFKVPSHHTVFCLQWAPPVYGVSVALSSMWRSFFKWPPLLRV